jgi:cell division protein FtsW
VNGKTSIRVAALLLFAIVVLTIIARQPIITATLLPILTGLFVLFVDRWLKAREETPRNAASPAKRDERLDRAWRLARRAAGRPRSAGAAPPNSRLLLTAVLCLFAIGIVMVYSASEVRPGLFLNEEVALAYARKFAVNGLIGIGLMLFLARDGLQLARRYTAALLSISVGLLLATRLPHIGLDVNGASRWIQLDGFTFQPSSLVKVALVLYSAHIVAARPSRVLSLAELARPLGLVAGACCLLITTQPDLGSAVVVGFAVVSVLLGGGLPMTKLALIAGTLGAVLLLYAIAQPYARARLTSFIDPWSHASLSGYQVVQSQIAIGSGGFFGRGLGQSIQKAYYLPDANTDFILAIIGEELGLVGISVLLFLYGLLAFAGLRIARQARSLYGFLVGIGLTSIIVVQTLLNIFSVLGLAPEFGVTLPFISYGSSDLTVMFVSVGLLLSIPKEALEHEAVYDLSARRKRLPAFVQERVGVAFAFFLVLLVVVGARSFYLAIVRGASLRGLAAAQQHLDEVIPAPRGVITDRFGNMLVESEPTAELSADPELLPSSWPVFAAQRLAPLLGQPVAEVSQKLRTKSGFVYLARGLPQNRVRAILALRIPGVSATPTTRRRYPRTTVAAQVLGSVGIEGRGLAGLEYGWNRVLTGTNGNRSILSSALGQPLSIKQTTRMLPGKSLQLTLDSYMQAETERILAGVARKCDCAGAAALILEPDTGEVLALANWPTLRLGDTASLNGQELQADLRDRITNYDFEPGRLLAPFPVAAALQESLITPTESFLAPSRISVGAGTVEEAPGGTRLTVAQLASGASRTGTLLVASKLGLSRLRGWLGRFGFGARSGIDLPDESTGHVLNETEYGRSTLTRLPLGQDLTVTPIQLARAFAVIASDGTLRTPHIVAKVAGRPVTPPTSSRVLSPATAAMLRQMLASANGRGVEVPVPAPHDIEHTGAFVGFAPIDHPQVVTVTLVAEDSGEANAEALAASAYRQITAAVLPYLGTR